MKNECLKRIVTIVLCIVLIVVSYPFKNWQNGHIERNNDDVIGKPNPPTTPLFIRGNMDSDNDGLSDEEEQNIGTNPNNVDSDSDGMWDGWENCYDLDPLNASDRFLDLDGDGLPNYLEFAYPAPDQKWWDSTDPLNPDTDGDGMPDGWEAYNAILLDYDTRFEPSDIRYYITSLDPTIPDSDRDVDTIWSDLNGDSIVNPGEYISKPDNLTNLIEYCGTFSHQHGTNPNNPDTDGDGIKDSYEILSGFPGELVDGLWCTNPRLNRIITLNASNPDTDMDGLNDSREVNIEKTNPLNPDTDYDGILDVDEISRGTNPILNDTDIDGMTDYEEINAGTDPLQPNDKTSDTIDVGCSFSPSFCTIGKQSVVYFRISNYFSSTKIINVHLTYPSVIDMILKDYSPEITLDQNEYRIIKIIIPAIDDKF